MKYIKICLACCMVLLLASCDSAGKYYEEGIKNLDIKNYAEAETCFENAISEGYTKDNIDVIYTIVSAYNDAKACYDAGNYDEAGTHIDKIPHTYSNYLIGIDINTLKDQLKKIEEVDTSVVKAKNLLELGEYDDAYAIVLMLDSQDLTADQLTEVEQLKKQVQIKRKNKDYEVLRKIDELIETYTNGLCEAVNTGDFRPLKGSLYEGSKIYKEQKSYIASMANKEIYEYVQDYKVNSVEWQSETSCIISTSETYDIYNYDEGSNRTQTFRYTYDVIETGDGQLFLTAIRKSS